MYRSKGKKVSAAGREWGRSVRKGTDDVDDELKLSTQREPDYRDGTVWQIRLTVLMGRERRENWLA